MSLQLQIPYSFADVNCTISGPGGTIAMGAGAGSAEEGINYEPMEDTERPKIGADGAVAHALNASRAFRVIVRLLKTSPQNQALHTMYNFQRTTVTNWAQNTLVISSSTMGDIATFTGVAFLKVPPNTYSKDVTNIEWEFLASQGDIHLGGGISSTPTINLNITR